MHGESRYGASRFHGLAVLLAVGVIGCGEGPPPPLRIAPETTLITEPLADDGYPDFARAFVDRRRQEVTPENNGAIPFWQAIGPAEIDPEHRELLFSEIGCPVPELEGALTSYRDELDDSEFREAIARGLAVAVEDDRIDEVVDKIRKLSQRRVWKGEESAALKEWIDANRKPLDLLREAAAKPKFFSPPPNLLTEPPAPVVATLLYDAQEIPKAFRALCARTMLRITSGSGQNAWDDVAAALSLAEQMESRDTLVEQMVGVAGRELAYKTTIAWLDSSSVDHDVRAALDRLTRARELGGVRNAMEFGEPLVLIDSVVGAFVAGRPGADSRLIAKKQSVDLNTVLLYCRSWQERAAEIAAIEDRSDRRRRAVEFEGQLEKMAASLNSPTLSLRNTVSCEKRSETIGRVFVANVFPALSVAIAIEDRCVARRRMTVLAAALRLHRLQSDNYPDSLVALTPDPLEELPIDPFSGEPFRYQRRGDGFVLWSVGENGVDDRANDADGEFNDGDYAPIDWFGEREKPEGVDDLVVRLPVPELRLPDFAAETKN